MGAISKENKSFEKSAKLDDEMKRITFYPCSPAEELS
jgi:hypothetical protein